MTRPLTAAVRLLSGEREPVRVATTINVDLYGLENIDNVALAVGDRVLLTGQTDTRENGIYTVSTGRWYRAGDANHPRAITEGVTVQVQEGATHGGQAWRFRQRLPNIGSDPILIDFYLSANFEEDSEAIITANKADLLGYAEARKTDLISVIDAEEASALAAVAASSIAAADSAFEAGVYANDSADSAADAAALVLAAEAGFIGFEDGQSYDFGFVSDPMTYFDQDFGELPAV